MKKKLVAVMLCFAFALSLAACGGSASSAAPSMPDSAPASSAAADSEPAAPADYKIGIMTTSVSQGEEGFRVAERLQEEYPDIVEVVLFPDKATTEQETTISNALSLASDPDVKAIVFSQAVQGTAAACQKVREIRPDILLIAAGYSDDAATTAANCDIFFHTNVPKLGLQIVDAHAELGVENFVHYSFPRHLAMQIVAERLQKMKDRCGELGLNLIEATTPDPMSDAGTTGTQQFVLEDVPRQIDEHGVMTTFFGTNIGQQEPMIKSVVETKSYYTTPSDPSPFGAYPAALGIEVPSDKAFDVDYMMQAISDNLAEKGMTGHMGCWNTSVLTIWTEGAFQYAKAFCEGKTDGMQDYEAFKQALVDVSGGEMDIENIVDNGVTYENGFFILCEYHLF